MSSFFYTFSIQLFDAGRAEQNLEKLATCTIFSQKACAKLLLDFSRIYGIIILVKRGIRSKADTETKGANGRTETRQRKVNPKNFLENSKKPLDKQYKMCYNNNVERNKNPKYENGCTQVVRLFSRHSQHYMGQGMAVGIATR